MRHADGSYRWIFSRAHLLVDEQGKPQRFIGTARDITQRRADEESLRQAIDACHDGDLDRLGRIAETNALRMHALIQSCDPPIRYLTAASVTILDRVAELRARGIAGYATIDAGPNIVVISRPADVEEVRASLEGLADLVITGPRPGLRIEMEEAVT